MVHLGGSRFCNHRRCIYKAAIPQNASFELFQALSKSARKALGLEAAETTIIGDTMDTGIRGGVQMGYKTILVLSGITRKEDLKRYAFKPDMVVESVSDIKFPLPWW